MVASGLEPGMTAVAPLKLALHLVVASIILGGIVWIAAGLRPSVGAALVREGKPAAPRVLLGLILVQIALGGLVAGSKAGFTYNTWPLMDGRLVPAGLGLLRPAWLNLVDNVTTIQFCHRLGAYALAAAILAYAVVKRRGTPPARERAMLMSAVLLAQLALGIATLVNVVPTGLALAHQGTALILLFVLVWNAAVMRRAA